MVAVKLGDGAASAEKAPGNRRQQPERLRIDRARADGARGQITETQSLVAG